MCAVYAVRKWKKDRKEFKLKREKKPKNRRVMEKVEEV